MSPSKRLTLWKARHLTKGAHVNVYVPSAAHSGKWKLVTSVALSPPAGRRSRWWLGGSLPRDRCRSGIYQSPCLWSPGESRTLCGPLRASPNRPLAPSQTLHANRRWVLSSGTSEPHTGDCSHLRNEPDLRRASFLISFSSSSNSHLPRGPLPDLPPKLACLSSTPGPCPLSQRLLYFLHSID